METNEITIKVTVEYPRGQHTEDFTVDRATWEAMSDLEKDEYVDREFVPTLMGNAGIYASHEEA